MISYKCRKCGFVFEFSDETAGKRAKCRNCEAVFRIPGGGPPPAPEPSPASNEATVRDILLEQQRLQAAQQPRYKRSNPSQIGNGVAAILSFFIPGLGQICQNRAFTGLLALVFTVAGYFFFILPGLIFHLLVIADAASWKEPMVNPNAVPTRRGAFPLRR